MTRILSLRTTYHLSIVLVAVVVLAACGGAQTDDTLPTVAPTSPPIEAEPENDNTDTVPDPAATEAQPAPETDPNATPEVTAEATPEVTPEVRSSGSVDIEVRITVQPGDLPPISDDGAYIVLVTGGNAYAADDERPENVEAPPDGQQWVIVNTTLQYYGAGETMIGEAHLLLIDAEGNAYPPVSGEMNSRVIGATIPANQSLRTSVSFLIPAEAEPIGLRWCPEGNCAQPIQAEVLLINRQ